MRYLHSIERTDRTDFPAWQAVALADGAEEYEGTAADYGREALDTWIADNSDGGATDEYGSPLLRVRVAFAEDPEPFGSNSNIAATVMCNQLDRPDGWLAALEAARERKLYVKLLDVLADDALEEALRVARPGAPSANWLADFVYPAVSRPIALRMMR